MYLLILIFSILNQDISNTNMLGITQMYHLQDDTFVILHKRKGHQVSIYNAQIDDVIVEGIPFGKGPGESLGLTAFFHDQENKNYIFVDEIGNILITDYSLKVSKQKNLGNVNINSITKHGNEFVAGVTTMFRPSLNDSLVVAVYINPSTLDVSREVKFEFKDLVNRDYPNLDKLMLLLLNTYVFSDSSELYISFKNYPKVFRVSKDDKLIEYAIFTNLDTFQVTRSGEMWGTRMIAICNTFQKVNSHIVCWNGNTVQEIKPSYYLLDIDNKISTGPYELKYDFSESSGSSIAVFGENSLILTDKATVLANSNFIYRIINPKFQN